MHHVDPISPQESMNDGSDVVGGSVIGEDGEAKDRSSRATRASGSRDARAAGSEAQGDEMQGDAEDEQEAERPRGVSVPHKPSAKEIEEHNLTHCPPRSWCDH